MHAAQDLLRHAALGLPCRRGRRLQHANLLHPPARPQPPAPTHLLVLPNGCGQHHLLPLLPALDRLLQDEGGGARVGGLQAGASRGQGRERCTWG